MTRGSVADSSALIGHLEGRLGRLVYGWSRNPDGEPMPFQVARFEGGAYEGVLGFATVGLGLHELESPTTGRPLHLELTLCVHEVVGERNVPALMQQVALRVLESGQALLRGDVIELGGYVIAETAMTGLYATMPVYFDESFATCSTENGTETAIVWLVPVHPSEAEFVRTRGWQAFEEVLQEQDPDLFDPLRAPLVLAR
jgi:hypothetical protein